MAEERPPAPRAYRWKDQPGRLPGAPPSPSRRRRKILVVVIAMLALAGTAIGLVILFHTYHGPDLRAVPITQYENAHLPANPLAVEDGKALGKYFHDPDLALAHQGGDLLIRKFRDFTDLPSKRPLVFHLSAYAIALPRGVYVLPADASPDDPRNWCAVADLLGGLKASSAAHKLVLLDLMKPMADPRLGRLNDDIAGRLLPALLEAVKKDSTLWILCSCSEGQVAHVSEEMGQSVFAFYVGEGLRGHADGYNNDGRPGRVVTVRELAQFVRVRVDRWVERNRHQRQTPELVAPGDGDVLLANLEGAHFGDDDGSTPTGAYPSWLTQIWELRDRTPREATAIPTPRAFRKLEASLLQAEQRWRGRMDDSQIQSDLKAAKAAFESQVTRGSIERPPPHSLALEEAVGHVVTDAAAVAEMKALLALLDRSAPPGQKEADQGTKKEMEEGSKKFLARFEKAPSAALPALTVWVAMTDERSPRPEKLQLAVRLLQTLPEALRRDYAETLYLQHLAQVAATSSKQWPPDTVFWALQANKALQKAAAAAAAEPRTMPWVGTALAAAAAEGRRAETLLSAQNARDAAEAPHLLEEIQRKIQDDIVPRIETLRGAYETLDKALLRLPDTITYLTALPESDEDDRNYVEAIDWTRGLAGLLANPPTEPAALADRIDQVASQARKLRGRFKQLHEPFSKERLKAFVSAEPTGAEAVDALLRADAYLRTPFFEAKDRADLWEFRRKLAAGQHKHIRDLDQEDDEHKPFRKTEALAFDAKAEGNRCRRRAVRLAKLSLACLKLGNADGITKTENLLATAQPDPSDPNLDALAADCHRAWMDVGAQILGRLNEKKDWTSADQLSRVLHPFDPGADTALDDLQRNPAVRLRRQADAACWGWLANFCRQEADGRDDPALGAFLQRAAEKYSRAEEYSR